MHILVQYPFDDEQIEAMRRLVESYGDHQISFAKNEEEALDFAAKTEVLLGHFTPSVCAAAPRLKWIQSFSAGMNDFLFEEIVARDQVIVTNMAGIYAPQGGEHAWALLLALARGLHVACERKAQKRWGGVNVIEITGSTMLIIGLGGFGLEILKRAQGYDMEVLALDPVQTQRPDGVSQLLAPTTENLHDFLERADAVMVACPYTPQTHHLIGAAALDRMKKTAYLVNVTRGGIVDEAALVDALAGGRIAGAALDVVENEPLSADNPLWDAPNLILTPHRAGGSQHRPRKVFEFFCQNLQRLP